ncbi:MAG: PL29 family lyase N-terminal domain-containing protein [Bacteroides sp.]
MLGTVGTFTSCKDYDDDIENLQGQITTMKGTVDDLKQKIEGGLVVTSVAKTDNGVNITFSNGQTYELKNGADGKNGKDATVWSIGQDGYWYLDGVKTEYKAAGANGYYYKPNAETGCFDIYVIDENGKEKFVEATTISYVSAVEGVSVVHDGNKLIIKGAVDSQGNTTNVELNLGKELASVAFVPDFLDEYSKYPLAKFYHVDAFLDETKYVTTGANKYDFIEQTKLDKSNEVKLTYRVNPQGAYVEGAVLNFINRPIKQTKAIKDDDNDLLNVVSTNISNEQIIVNASINASNRDAANEGGTTAIFDLAALQTSVGTGVPVTSDYIAVRSEEVEPILVDSVQTTATTTVKYYNRTKAITTDNVENHDFVRLFVPAVANVTGTDAIPAHLKFAYKDASGNAGKIDLRKKVGLFVEADHKYLTSYGINSMSYEFSLPAEYKDVDANHTNQQWFVKLNGSELSINTDNLTGGLTQAIGRRPVVRVDAFLTNNAGAKKLVASAYIRLEIVERDPVTVSAHNIELGAAKSYEYHALEANDTEVANMAWSRINNEIYGAESLTATNFWNFYGTDADTYEVKVITYHKTTGNEEVLLDERAVPSDRVYTNNTDIPGISLRIDLNANAGTTSVIKVGTNNKVKTENSYKDMGNGAQYKVTITIKSDDPTQHGHFILTQVINVKDDCKYYEFNPLYYFDSWNNVAGDYIVVKGKVDQTAGTWKLTSKLSEHFKLVGNQNIFQYSGRATDPVKNVEQGTLVFDWTENDARPAGNITDDRILDLDHAMSVSEEIKNMNYQFKLKNGEICKTAYKVVFVNPFVAGSPAAVTLHGNAIGAQNVATAPSVIVKDKAGDDIYKWNTTASALALTAKATNDYQVGIPNVDYAWVEDANFNSFVSQLTNRNQLQLAGDGTVTWDNEGATLANSHNLKVKATVTFTDLSIVEVIIPVTITNTAN